MATCALRALLLVKLPPRLHREPQGPTRCQRPERPLHAAERPGRPRALAAPPRSYPVPPRGLRAPPAPAPARGAAGKPGGCRFAPVAPLPPASP